MNLSPCLAVIPFHYDRPHFPRFHPLWHFTPNPRSPLLFPHPPSSLAIQYPSSCHQFPRCRTGRHCSPNRRCRTRGLDLRRIGRNEVFAKGTMSSYGDDDGCHSHSRGFEACSSCRHGERFIRCLVSVLNFPKLISLSTVPPSRS